MKTKYRVAIRDAMAEAMVEDERVVVLGQDVGKPEGLFRITEGLWNRFGDSRVIDTPISEAGTAGAAIGLALLGYRPIVEVAFSDHLTMCFDAIVNQMAKIPQMFPTQVKGLPIVIRAMTGAGIGGGPQHSQSIEAWFAHVPGLAVVTPATPSDAKGLLKSAVLADFPVLYLEHKALLRTSGEITDDPIPLGSAAVIRSGEDVTIVSYSATMPVVLEASDHLREGGIRADVIDLRSVFPLDTELIMESVRKTRRLLVVHEAHRFAGVGAEICAQVGEAFSKDVVAISRVTSPPVAVPVSRELEKEYIVKPRDVIEAATELASPQ